MPGTDVDRLFLDVLPRLASGVLIHVHDIFLPEGYPPDWIWRGYNEQIVVGALLAGGGYELVFASSYALEVSLLPRGTRRPPSSYIGSAGLQPLASQALIGECGLGPICS